MQQQLVIQSQTSEAAFLEGLSSKFEALSIKVDRLVSDHSGIFASLYQMSVMRTTTGPALHPDLCVAITYTKNTLFHLQHEVKTTLDFDIRANKTPSADPIRAVPTRLARLAHIVSGRNNVIGKLLVILTRAVSAIHSFNMGHTSLPAQALERVLKEVQAEVTVCKDIFSNLHLWQRPGQGGSSSACAALLRAKVADWIDSLKSPAPKIQALRGGLVAIDQAITSRISANHSNEFKSFVLSESNTIGQLESQLNAWLGNALAFLDWIEHISTSVDKTDRTWEESNAIDHHEYFEWLVDEVEQFRNEVHAEHKVLELIVGWQSRS